MKRFLILTVIISLLTTTELFAQRAKLVIEAMSPDRLKEKGWTSNISSGLPIVGKGTTVYLSAKEVTGTPVTAASWELLTKPAGSNTTLDSTTTIWTTFSTPTPTSNIGIMPTQHAHTTKHQERGRRRVLGWPPCMASYLCLL